MRCSVVFIVVAGTIAISLLSCRRTSQGRSHDPKRESTASDTSDTGTQTHNGLNPTDFLLNLKSQNIQKAWEQSLLDMTGMGNLNNTFDSFYPTSYKTLADDMISCTVYNTVVKSYNMASIDLTDTYKPLSSNVLSSATNWKNNKLDADQQKDVATCLATRLNPSATPVDIWLSGDHVVNNHVKPLPIDEALWDTEFITRPPNSPLAPIAIYVWPSDEIRNACLAFVPALKTRICGTSPALCDLRQRDRGTDNCKPDGSGHYGCDSPHQSVVQTRLSCKDWCTLYPGCKVPQLPGEVKCETESGLQPGDTCPSMAVRSGNLQ